MVEATTTKGIPSFDGVSHSRANLRVPLNVEYSRKNASEFSISPASASQIIPPAWVSDLVTLFTKAGEAQEGGRWRSPGWYPLLISVIRSANPEGDTRHSRPPAGADTLDTRGPSATTGRGGTASLGGW